MKTEAGTENDVAGYIGLPSSGKSTLMMRHALQLLARGVIVLLSDPNGDAPSVLEPDKTRVPMHRCSSLSEWQRNVVNVFVEQSPSELVTLARAIAAQSIEVRDGKVFKQPVAVLVDEVTSWDEVESQQYLGKLAKKLFTQRRHWHVIFWFGTQTTRDCNKRLFTYSTKLWLFMQEDRDDLDKLRRGAVPDKVIEWLPRLPPYTCLEYRRIERKTLVHRPKK